MRINFHSVTLMLIANAPSIVPLSLNYIYSLSLSHALFITAENKTRTEKTNRLMSNVLLLVASVPIMETTTGRRSAGGHRSADL